MKASIEHLPPKKQRQLAAIVDEVRAAIEVEMVVLFGSHARGDWVEDPVGGHFSDFDILVIVKSPEVVEQHDLWSAVEQRAARHAAPTELTLIVHDAEDVNRQLELGQYFFSDIVKEGIVLHDAGRLTLHSAKEKAPEERQLYHRSRVAGARSAGAGAARPGGAGVPGADRRGDVSGFVPTLRTPVASI